MLPTPASTLPLSMHPTIPSTVPCQFIGNPVASRDVSHRNVASFWLLFAGLVAGRMSRYWSLYIKHKKHISKRKNQKQPWQTNEILGVADERRQAKVTGDRGRWEIFNKEFSKSAREDKNAYIEGKCREMEKDKTNSKKAFRISKN